MRETQKNRQIRRIRTLGLMALIPLGVLVAPILGVLPLASALAVEHCGYGTGSPGTQSFTMHWVVECPYPSYYAKAYAKCTGISGHQGTVYGPIVNTNGASSKADCGSLAAVGEYGYYYGNSSSSLPYSVKLGSR